MTMPAEPFVYSLPEIQQKTAALVAKRAKANNSLSEGASPDWSDFLVTEEQPLGLTTWAVNYRVAMQKNGDVDVVDLTGLYLTIRDPATQRQSAAAFARNVQGVSWFPRGQKERRGAAIGGSIVAVIGGSVALFITATHHDAAFTTTYMTGAVAMFGGFVGGVGGVNQTRDARRRMLWWTNDPSTRQRAAKAHRLVEDPPPPPKKGSQVPQCVRDAVNEVLGTMIGVAHVAGGPPEYLLDKQHDLVSMVYDIVRDPELMDTLPDIGKRSAGITALAVALDTAVSDINKKVAADAAAAAAAQKKAEDDARDAVSADPIQAAALHAADQRKAQGRRRFGKRRAQTTYMDPNFGFEQAAIVETNTQAWRELNS